MIETHQFLKTMEEVRAGLSHITEERKALIEQIAVELVDHQLPHLTFICTHNSRRSQLAEAWFNILVEDAGLAQMQAYSGGTESTAFNHRMVAALTRKGFLLEKIMESANPVYQLRHDRDILQHLYFSKKYDDDYNPSKDYMAIMVCSSADKGCPVVFGATKRYTMTYIDPKVSDDTEEETSTYENKVIEIGSQILYLVNKLQDLTPR